MNTTKQKTTKKDWPEFDDLEVPPTPPPIDPRTGEERRRRFVTAIRAEQYWVEKARKSPIFFQHYITGEKPAAHHELWLRNIFHPLRKRLNFIAPRESAKTTTILCALSWYIGHNPFSTNCIISVASQQAKDRLGVIRGYIEDNPRYSNVFPDIHIDLKRPNTQHEFTLYSDRNGIAYNTWKALRDRRADAKDATIFVAGAGGRGIIGRRFSGMLILDDIIDAESLSTAEQEKAEQYLMQTLIPCVKETGKVINIGTRWMLGDLPERLEKNPYWHTITIEAMKEDPETGEIKSYWPEYWPVERLEAKRQEMKNDALFEIMYQSNPRAMTANMFTLESLNQGLPFPLPEMQSIFIGTDFAISLKSQGDFTVFVAVGVDKTGNVYLLDMLRMKTTKDVYLDLLIDFYMQVKSKYGKCNGIVLENVGFQAALRQDLERLRPDIPYASHNPKGDKGHRVSYLSGLAMRKQLFINKKNEFYNIFVTEAMNFPLAPHDDTLDAITIVLQYLGFGVTAGEVQYIKSPFLL